MQDNIRPRRSCLYLPGDKPRVHEKARNLPADMLIFDLEDAVAPDAKAEARELTRSAIEKGGYGLREKLVRANAPNTPWGDDDVAMAIAAGADGVLIPKIDSAADITNINETIHRFGAAPDVTLWIMIETPLAILNLREIAATASYTRLAGMVIGTNDLAKDIQAITTPDRLAFQNALSLTVMAARAYGLAVIDGVYNDFRNDQGLISEARQGRTLGFDGKSCIHPAQLDSVNQAFAPDKDMVDHARAIVSAFADPANAAKGVISIDGQMAERLHLEQARRLLSVQAAIDNLSA